MNWIQRTFLKAAGVRTFRFLPEWVRNTYLPVTLRRLIDGYAKNSAVSACTTALAFSFPEAPLVTGKEMPDGRFVPDYGHMLMPLLRQPNADMGYVELMQFAVVYTAIGGNLYLWKQRRVNGQVMALWPFSDYNITPVPGITTADGFVKGYEFNNGSGQVLPLPKEDIIHWKWMPDIEQPWRGIGAIEFAIRDSDRDNEANAYIYALLKNNAVPPVVVTLAEGNELTDERAKRLRQEWNQKLGGENRGQLGFLEFGMKAEKIGYDLQQLAGEALIAVPEARIAAAFRVPPVVAGLSVGLKRSDYGDVAARRAFTELTLAALWQSLASEMYNGLKDDFGLEKTGTTLQFDLRKVRALQEEESKRWERVTLAFDRSGITRREMKEMLGIETKPGDDVYKVSLATEFIPADGDGVVERAVDEGPKTEDGGGTVDGGPKKKGRGSAGEEKGKAERIGRTLQRIRKSLAGKMEKDVDGYFSGLAGRIVERARGKGKAKKSDLPDAGSLFTNEDEAALTGIVKRYYVTVMELSWETWNIALGVEKAFDLTDPLVTEVLAGAGKQVVGIGETTRAALSAALQYANDQGWGIDELVRGDAENGIRGLREIVEETYKDRARTIARTELGEAQNAATVGRYKGAGVEKVLILDNGLDDDDDECKIANEQVWALSYFEGHPLEHPNCTRAAAAYFGDAAPDRE